MSKHTITHYSGTTQYNLECSISFSGGVAHIDYDGYRIIWNTTMDSMSIVGLPYDEQLHDTLRARLADVVEQERELERCKARNEAIIAGHKFDKSFGYDMTNHDTIFIPSHKEAYHD